MNQKLTLTLFELGHLTSSFEKIQSLTVNVFRETEKETDRATRKRTPKRTLKKNIASKNPELNTTIPRAIVTTDFFNFCFFKMVEAMYEISPEYFCKYQKLFCFFTLDTVPHFQGINVETFAYSLHYEKSDYCKLDLPHYQVLAKKEVMKKLDKDFSPFYDVPCLFTCFKILLPDLSTNLVFTGQLFEKLKENVDYNQKLGEETKNQKTGYRCKLPKFRQSSKRNIQNQTDLLPTSTNVRLLNLYNSVHFSKFSKIVDIMNSGYG